MLRRLLAPAVVGLLAAAPAPARSDDALARLKGLSLEDLMETPVTTVLRDASTVGRTPAAVFVITPEMIRRSGATTIPELLRLVPGMNVARIDNSRWAVSARGFNERFANKLLVQVDGRTLYNPLFAGVFWDAVDVPLEEVARIEVVRGPGASVWGANAVNGVVNIVTKAAAESQGGLARAGAGNEESGFAFARWGSRAGRWRYRVYARGFTRDEQHARDGDADDLWRGASFGARLERGPWSADAGVLRALAGRRDRRPLPAAPFSEVNLEDDATTVAHLRARRSRPFDGDSGSELQAYWEGFERGAPRTVDVRFDTLDLDLSRQSRLGERQKLTYGLGYRAVFARLGPSDAFASDFDRAWRRPQLLSAFVQDELELVEDRLSLTVGTKLERNDFTGFEVQPTARLLWSASPGQSAWAAVSRAVRTPNLADDEARRTSLQSAPGAGPFPRLVFNRDFRSEELLAYELGWRGQAGDASADLALFRHEYDGLRVNVPGTAFADPATGALILPLARQNRMEGRTYGAELAAAARPAPRWRLRAAYTWLRTVLHADETLGASTRRNAEAAAGQSPQHQASLRSSWDLPRDLELDLGGRFVDNLRGFNPGGAAGVADHVDAYLAVDARLGWRPRPGLELELVGRDLTRPLHAESGTSAAVRSPLVEIERSFYARAAWRF